MAFEELQKNNHLWSIFVLLTYFFDTKNWKGKSPSAYTWSSQDPALGVSSPSSPLQSSPPSTSGPPPTSLQESLRTPSLLGLSCERSPAAGLRGREHSRSPMLVILSWRNRTWSLHEKYKFIKHGTDTSDNNFPMVNEQSDTGRGD